MSEANKNVNIQFSGVPTESRSAKRVRDPLIVSMYDITIVY